MNQILRDVEKKGLKSAAPDFKPGDTLSVSVTIREGEKTRIQPFQGVVIKRHGSGISATFTVRKASGNVYVERVFPLHSPLVSEIKVVRRGRVRRSKLYYLRQRTGKATRIRESK
ncbi:MAG: 50S ribosomal protein L19 [Chitinivibrionales bacterium]|nr:50S ribosomal protein L19 [Chitinivibrionales bacterium]MBD3394138.1 50S ribosomal protein L19 [Chitinivibrionales bacterium]